MNAREVERFVRRITGKPAITIKEHGGYLIVETLIVRNNLAPHEGVGFLLAVNRQAWRKPKFSRRIRDILVISKQWGSLDAACRLYARRSRIRLECAGRPEAVAAAVEVYRPHAVSAIGWNPADHLPVCRGRPYYYYNVSLDRRVYICVLR